MCIFSLLLAWCDVVIVAVVVCYSVMIPRLGYDGTGAE